MAFHGIKCCTIAIWVYYVCIIIVIVLTHLFYFMLGKVLGLESTSPLDDFWLYDLPINPHNIPSALVFEKPEKAP